MNQTLYALPKALLLCGLLLHTLPASADHENDEAVEHIRLLEQMLRDAGVDPPARPRGLSEQMLPLWLDKVVPSSIDVGPFEKHVKVINREGKNAQTAIRHIRESLNHRDTARADAALRIIGAVHDWAQAIAEQAQAMAEDDPVGAYILAEDALALVDRDPIGQVIQKFLKQFKAERDDWRDIRSEASYRRAMLDAEAIGLTGDWALVDFGNTKVREEITSLTEKLRLITNAWPGNTGGKLAYKQLSEWRKKEAQAIANQPAWQYTYNLGLIWVGTRTETSIRVSTSGEVFIEQEETPTYERKRVNLFGTFQNTSDKPYRYTFNVGVSNKFNLGIPFPGTNIVDGVAQIQTPVLMPGQVYNWKTEIAVRSAGDIRRTGLGGVKAYPATAKQVELAEHADRAEEEADRYDRRRTGR